MQQTTIAINKLFDEWSIEEKIQYWQDWHKYNVGFSDYSDWEGCPLDSLPRVVHDHCEAYVSFTFCNQLMYKLVNDLFASLYVEHALTEAETKSVLKENQKFKAGDKVKVIAVEPEYSDILDRSGRIVDAWCRPMKQALGKVYTIVDADIEDGVHRLYCNNFEDFVYNFPETHLELVEL